MSPSASCQVSLLERISNATSRWAGSSGAFVLAFTLLVLWAGYGPMSHYSQQWQLVMNTVSSIVTFLMVFLIQRAQNKESLAVQVKLNELLNAVNGARNAMINAEDLSENELKKLHDDFGTIRQQPPQPPRSQQAP